MLSDLLSASSSMMMGRDNRNDALWLRPHVSGQQLIELAL